jgi:hypothetical protein
MAKIYKGTFTVGYMDDTATEGVDEFFEDLEAAFDEVGIEYKKSYAETTKSNYYDFFGGKVRLNFYQYKGIVYEQDSQIRVVLNGTSICGSIVDQQNLTQKYEIIISSYGDMMLRLSYANNPVQDIPNNNGVVFMICKCNNVVNPGESNVGIYAPWEAPHQGSPICQDHTPKYLLTADSDVDNHSTINNTGSAGNRSTATYTYILNTTAPITALVPIFAVSSQCVSINTKIMAIAPAPITGYAVLNGQRYYCVGQICMADDEE